MEVPVCLAGCWVYERWELKVKLEYFLQWDWSDYRSKMWSSCLVGDEECLNVVSEVKTWHLACFHSFCLRDQTVSSHPTPFQPHSLLRFCVQLCTTEMQTWEKYRKPWHTTQLQDLRFSCLSTWKCFYASVSSTLNGVLLPWTSSSFQDSVVCGSKPPLPHLTSLVHWMA
jgi:hypothetical protein